MLARIPQHSETRPKTSIGASAEVAPGEWPSYGKNRHHINQKSSHMISRGTDQGQSSMAFAKVEPLKSSDTFVLVHGAWHGGWCWRPVADALRAQGHRVFTPTQTGLGERKHLLSPEITPP